MGIYALPVEGAVLTVCCVAPTIALGVPNILPPRMGANVMRMMTAGVTMRWVRLPLVSCAISWASF